MAELEDLQADLDEGNKLPKFFGLLLQLNEDAPLDDGVRKKIESHFDYKYKNDRKIAIDDEEEQIMLI